MASLEYVRALARGVLGCWDVAAVAGRAVVEFIVSLDVLDRQVLIWFLLAVVAWNWVTSSLLRAVGLVLLLVIAHPHWCLVRLSLLHQSLTFLWTPSFGKILVPSA